MHARRLLRSVPHLTVSGLLSVGLVLLARRYASYDGIAEDVARS